MAPKRARASAAADSDSEGTDYSDAAPAVKKGLKKRVSNAKGGDKSKAKGKKGKGRAATDDEEEEEEEEEEEGGEPKKGKKGKAGALGDEERAGLIQSIVRHALFCEYNRRPLKREDVVKTILADGKGRHFPELYASAQVILKKTLGMELTQMRAKDNAGGKNPPKVYVLRSTLPPHLVKALVSDRLKELVVGAPADPSNVPIIQEVEEWNEEDGVMRDYKREEGGSYGLLGVILGLILVNSKVIGDDQLASNLKRLGLAPSSMIPSSMANASGPMSLSSYLALLTKQSYLERSKSATAGSAAPTQTQKKGKNDGGDAGDSSIEWKWGPRSDLEFGELGIARFLRDLMQGEEDMDESVEDKRIWDKRGAEWLTVIARAAGSKTLLEADGFNIEAVAVEE